MKGYNFSGRVQIKLVILLVSILKPDIDCLFDGDLEENSGNGHVNHGEKMPHFLGNCQTSSYLSCLHSHSGKTLKHAILMIELMNY